MSWKQLAVTAGLALVVVIGLVLGFRDRPVAVSVSEVGRGALRVTVESEGRTRVRERYVISSPVPAYTPRVVLDAGDSVERDQVLLELLPTPAAALDARARAEAEANVERARAAVDAAQSRLEAVQARRELARRELERVEPLHGTGAASRRELDRASSELREAEATVDSARYAVEVARQELRAARAALEYGTGATTPERIPLASPVDGRVLAVHHESQGTVRAGEPILTVGDPGSLEVEVDVLSADAVRIRPGMAVELHRWGGDEPLDGVVRVVEPSGFTKISALGVEEQRVLAIIDITSPHERWAGLGDGYRVEALFVLWQGDDVLQVPTSALFRENSGEWAVFVVSDGQVRQRRVALGHRGSLAVEVVDGLEAGEAVVTHPDNSLADGTRVEKL